MLLMRSFVSMLRVTPLTPSTSFAMAAAQALTSSPVGAFASADLYSGTYAELLGAGIGRNKHKAIDIVIEK